MPNNEVIKISRLSKLASSACFAIGILLVVSGIVINPTFVSNHFGSGGAISDTTEQATQAVRIISILTGVVAVLFALNLKHPTRLNNSYNRLSYLIHFIVGERFGKKRYYLFFCLLCFALACTIGILATQSGTGLSYDSMEYITAGKNLYNGNGFGSLAGESFNHYPLFPMLIAFLMYFGLGAEQAARLIPILSYALLVFPVFYLGKAICGILAGYLATIICLCLTPMVWLATWAWPDMTAILFSTLATLFLVKFSQTSHSNSRTLVIAGLFTGLAVLARFSAVALIPVGITAVIVKGSWSKFEVINNRLAVVIGARQSYCKTLWWAFLYSALCIIPFGLWTVRNTVATGRATAGFIPGGLGIFEGPIRLMDWIVVDSISDLLTSEFTSGINEVVRSLVFDLRGYFTVAIVLCILILMAVHISRHGVPGYSLCTWVKKNYIVIAHILSYHFVLIATGVIYYMLLQRNYLAAAYPFIVLILVSFMIYTFTRSKRGPLRPTFALVIVLLLMLTVGLNVGESVSYYQLAKHGQGGNSPQWDIEQGFDWISNNTPQDALIYSDMAEVIEYRLQKDALHLPHTVNKEGMTRFFQNLGTVENTFVIIFKGSLHRSYKPSNTEIASLNQEYEILEVVADFPTSTIWRVKDRPPASS